MCNRIWAAQKKDGVTVTDFATESIYEWNVGKLGGNKHR